MDYAVLKKVVEYGDVYELAAAGMTSVEELKTALKKNGATAEPCKGEWIFWRANRLILWLMETALNMTIRLLQRIF